MRRLAATFEHTEKTGFFHVPVHPESEVAGKMLSELRLRKRFHVSIVSLRRESGEALLTPDGTTVLMPHDMVLLSGTREDVSAVQRLFGKKQE
ncbi:MAG: TrkA C-terminal domain-containing protein [Methanocalculaceae archaeon]|nr:TrkA C-terminal domain-containing protein [Methanocalculaceae archaeon]